MPLERHASTERRVVHIAGEVVSGKQRCRACHIVLLDVAAMASDWLDDVLEAFPAGSPVLETSDKGEIMLSPAAKDETAPLCQRLRYRGKVEGSLYVR